MEIKEKLLNMLFWKKILYDLFLYANWRM